MDKPFKTIDEQVKLMQKRGINTDENTANVLKREGYYSVVNGYKDIFIDKSSTMRAGEDRYKDGTRFEDIHRLFLFDRDLKLAMSRYFHIAEATLKTICAYQFTEAHQDEPEPYLNIANYRNDCNYDRQVRKLVKTLGDMIGRNPGSTVAQRKSYLVHYVHNHDEVPLWVLTNYMMFGQIFKFFSFQKEAMRNKIARSFSELYNETHEETRRIYDRDLNLSYSHMKDFRNICAHDERLFCARVSPAKDITFADVVSDLGLVLTKNEDLAMIETIFQLINGAIEDIGEQFSGDLLTAMGISSIDKVLIIRE